jgi:hypothetical protein
MDNRDPDFRFMALNDLIPALDRDTFRMDARQERELCKKLVGLFADVAGDIRGHAIKWYGEGDGEEVMLSTNQAHHTMTTTCTATCCRLLFELITNWYQLSVSVVQPQPSDCSNRQYTSRVHVQWSS